MMKHKCKQRPRMGEGSAHEVFMVDRPRKVTMRRCAGCGESWDVPEGAAEFAIWADGYRNGHTDAANAASMIPNPDQVAWAGGTFEL